MKLFKKLLISAASLGLLVSCGENPAPTPKKYSIIYKVNGGTDLSRINENSSILPSEGEIGKKVSVHIAAKSGYDYMAFMPNVPSDYPEEQAFYDQFADYTLREDTFSFIMPKCDVTINFNIQEHADRYNVTFDNITHATFSFSGSDDNPFAQGEKVHFVVNVDSGYELDGYPFVVGDSTIEINKSVTDVYSFDMPAKTVTVSATVKEKITQKYSVTLANVAHVEMKKHPSVPSLTDLEENDQVIIVVTPEQGYVLVGIPFIVGDSSVIVAAATGVTNGYRFVMPAKDVTFSCTVQQSSVTKYAVSFASVSHASFSISGTSDTLFAEGTQVIFYVQLDAGYRLNGYPFVVGESSIEVGKYSSTGTTFYFSMPAKAVTISANVEAIPTYVVTLDDVDNVSLSGHTPSDLSKVEEGSQVIIIVAPASGYELDGYPFIVGDDSITVSKSSAVENGYFFTMPSKAVTFSVKVKESIIEKYTVSFATVTGLTFSKHSTSENPCEAGQPFMFNIAIADGVTLVGAPYIVGDSSIQIGADQYGTYFFTMPAKNVTVSANVSGTPRTLDHLSLGTKKTEYQVNEDFVKPQVFAHYDNLDVVELASTAFTCSGYNMAVADTYTVTVSYTKNGVTKTTTYDITVSGKIPSNSVSLTKRYVLLNGNYNVYYIQFDAEGNGYYERSWTSQSTTYRVNFKYTTVTENYWRIYDPVYVGSAAYDNFQNDYRMFAHPDFIDYQESFFYSYTDSIEVRLLNCGSGGVSKQAFKSFALESN